MRQILAPALLAAVLAAPVHAQDTGAPSRMEEGARLFFEGLMDEMDPALRDLQGLARDMGPFLEDFVSEMGPALRDLMAKVEDWSLYHPPEILPNGDILIRRKTDDDRVEEPDAVDL